MNSEDHQIFQLLDKELYKQATQFVGSLRKRYPSSSYYKILEQYVKFKQSPGKFNYDESLAPILDAKSPPNDSRSLRIAHTFLLELGFDTTKALQPYEKAMLKYANSDTCYEWFLESLRDLNWRHLSKATFQMPRLNEKSKARIFQFWNSLATVIWFELDSESMTEKETALLPKLTYKLTKELQPFVDEQELFIFCRVCELFDDKSQEVVDNILQFWKEDSYLDLNLKNFLLKHLSKLKDSESILKYGTKLLKNLDDYEILREVIGAAHITGVSYAKVLELLGARDTRNYQLARIQAAKLFELNLEEPLKTYIMNFHSKPCCVADLRSFELDSEILKEILTSLPSSLVHDKTVVELFGESKKKSAELFLQYKASLLTKPKTDYSNCSYFLLEIVKSLVNDNNFSLKNVITSLTLLEGYQAEDPFNYDTRVWLILLYMHLGLPNKAFHHFESLKIKNVQNDLVHHWLFTRFSTMLPNKNAPYFKHISSEQAIYSSLKNMHSFIVAAFERRSWSKIPGIISFYERIFKSYTRWNSMAESLQLSRILNEKKTDQTKILYQQLSIFGVENFKEQQWSDNRDFSVFSKSMDGFQTVSSVMAVDKSWLAISIARELVFTSLARNEKNDFVDVVLEQSIKSDSLTSMEYWAWNIAQILYRTLSQEGLDYENLKTHLEKCPKIEENTWNLNHSYLLKLGTLRTLDQLKRIKDKDVKQLIKNHLKNTRSACVEFFETYAEKVAKLQLDEQFYEFNYPNQAVEIALEIRAVLKSLRNL